MNERILIIDDEETLCYFLKESLEEKGYQALTAHTAGYGLEVATSRQIDLVLLDLKLPDGNGVDVLRELRKTDSDLPVIVLTGHAAVETAVEAMKLGAYDYLEKPVNLAELSAGVAGALESRRRRSVALVESARDVEMAAGPVGEAREAVQVSATRDDGWAQRAELLKVQRKLERKIEEVVALDSISADMMGSLNLDDVVQKTVEGLIRLSSVDMAAAFLADKTGRELALAHQRRFPSHIWRDIELRRLLAEDPLAKSFGRVEGALPLGEAGASPWARQLSARLGNDIATLLIPVTDGGDLRGLVVIGHRGGQPFDRLQTQTLCSIGKRLARVVAHAGDMSWLRKRVAQLEEREAVREGMLRAMMSGLIAVDLAGKVTLVNRAAEELLGCREGEVLGRPVKEVLGRAAGIVRHSLERELSYSGEEILAGREQRVPLGMAVSPLRAVEGEISGAVIMLNDLREAKALEEESKRLDRLALLAELSAVIAHEIRNPLAAMGAGIQHLLTKFEEGDERHEALELILKEGERVNRIIEDMLLISRPPHLNLAACDVLEVLDGVLSVRQQIARRQGVEIKKYYASQLPVVKADKLRLHQALSNVLLNAIDAMPHGGELRIAVTGPGGVELVGGGLQYVDVELRCDGAVIGAEEAQRLFDPFYARKAGRSGLELPIARRIINAHGGEIEIEVGGEGGKRTRFIVRLPVPRGEADE